MSSIENKRIALFPGTFDPFTIGHQSLVRRGLELVDEIVISIGINAYLFLLGEADGSDLESIQG